MNPYTVYDSVTGETIDQSASLERAKDRLWELTHESSRWIGTLLNITNLIPWEEDRATHPLFDEQRQELLFMKPMADNYPPTYTNHRKEVAP